MPRTRAGKNSGPGQFGSGQIGHSDKNFIPRPCSDYKSDTLTRPGPGPECPMSGPGCPNVRICNIILGDSDQNFVWPNPNPIFQCPNPVVRIFFIKFSKEFGLKLHINIVVRCPNPVVRLSDFVRTRNGSKIRTTRTRMSKPEPDPV